MDVFGVMNYDELPGVRNEQMRSLGESVEATQISQRTIFQWGIAHVRRRKPKSSGFLNCVQYIITPRG